MYIALVEFAVASQDRDRALGALFAEAPEVRALPGNLAFRPFADPEDAGRVVILHEWRDAASFAGYQASAAFRRSGEVLRPLMTAPPRSRRLEARLVEEV